MSRKCPNPECGNMKTHITDTRGEVRHRRCYKCGWRWQTQEVVVKAIAPKYPKPALKPTGCATPLQDAILDCLVEHGPATTRQIAERLHNDPKNIYRAVDILHRTPGMLYISGYTKTKTSYAAIWAEGRGVDAKRQKVAA